jgi:uncharacterized membrane protein
MTDNVGLRVATGLKKDRTEALHDAIYAVVMTLLVLNLHVPHGATSFADFLRQLRGDLPEFYAGAFGFSIAGLMWLNNYYRSSLVVRVDLTHIVLTIAAAGLVVLFPFTTQALAEYWVNPWGITIWAWNYTVAVALYGLTAVHDVRHLIPKQVDQRFLRLNLTLLWVYAFAPGILVPALALFSPLAAVLTIPVICVINLFGLARMEPRYIEAHRIAMTHAEDDLRQAT